MGTAVTKIHAAAQIRGGGHECVYSYVWLLISDFG